MAGNPSGYHCSVDGDADLVERIRAYPRRRTYLLPAVHDVQHSLGWLPGEALETVGAHLRVPKSEVYGVASSFPDFLLAEPAEHVRRVCIGPASRMAARPPGLPTLPHCPLPSRPSPPPP